MIPKVGDEIYVPTSLYLSHGRDDVEGGLAKVTEVCPSKDSPNQTCIRVAEHPNDTYWWSSLETRQDELKLRFGTRRAYPDPDNRPDMNRFD
jgi:hypothetical protein